MVACPLSIHKVPATLILEVERPGTWSRHPDNEDFRRQGVVSPRCLAMFVRTGLASRA